MHSDYRNSVMRHFRDQETWHTPRLRKLQRMQRAEALVAEIDPTRDYSYEYALYRLTEERAADAPHVVMTGEDLLHDLLRLIEDLSDAADLRADEMGEPVWTVEQLGRRLNVSTKTISRWRQQGLVSRRFLFGRRKRVGFVQSSVDRFVHENRERVNRGARFSQLSEEEKMEIVDRARRMARVGDCASEVTRRVAEHMQRSVETIRYTLKQFDEQNPELAIFPENSGPLNEEAKRAILKRHRRGETVDQLAKAYNRTRTSVYRIINEMRAKRILELPLDCIHNECFEKPANEAKILAPMPEPDTPPRKVRVPSGLPPYLMSLYEVPLLTKEQEQHVFRKFNYLKYKADQLRQDLDPGRASSALMDEIERLYDEAIEVKNLIVQSNLRLVVSIAKRHVNASDNFFELVSDGNMSLIRAVEKFDYARGNKFSTYASWAIMKNFARTIPEEFKQRDRFRSGTDELFVTKEDIRGGQYEQESAQQLRKRQIVRMLDRLDEREQQIIISRFGLDHKEEPRTLKEVGAQLGVTKERIRQIEARALDKLRRVAEQEKIELPEWTA